MAAPNDSTSSAASALPIFPNAPRAYDESNLFAAAVYRGKGARRQNSAWHEGRDTTIFRFDLLQGFGSDPPIFPRDPGDDVKAVGVEGLVPPKSWIGPRFFQDLMRVGRPEGMGRR